MRFVARLSRTVIDALSRSAAGAGVNCRRVDVSVIPDGPGRFLVHAHCKLESVLPEGTDRLILSTHSSSLKLVDISVSDGFQVQRRGASEAGHHGPIVAFSTVSGKQQVEFEAEMTYHWVPARGSEDRARGNCLVLPDALHLPVAANVTGSNTQCRLQFAEPIAPPGVSVTGIKATGDGQGDVYLQAVIWLVGDAAPVHGSKLISFSPALLKELDGFDRGRLEVISSNALTFFGSWYKMPLPGGIVMVAPNDIDRASRMAPGTAIGVTPDVRGHISLPSWNLLVQLARPWWGIGCRLTGPGGKALRNGIGLALAIEFLELNDPTLAPTVLAYFKRVAARYVALDALAPLRGKQRLVQASRIALALRTDASREMARSVLGDMLRANWGNEVPAYELASVLGLGSLL